MNYSVTCSCGNRVPVLPSSCGSDVRCRCGAVVHVPRLSELRMNAGQAAFEVNTSDRLQVLYREGRLPLESSCVGCGRQTAQVLDCKIECERMRVKSPRDRWLFGVLMALFNPLLGLGHMLGDWFDFDRKQPVGRVIELIGNDLLVDAPVRICQACFASSSRKEPDVRQWLHETELYAQLLNEFPEARVFWNATLK